MHDVPLGEVFDPEVEGVARRHIFEDVGGDRLVEAGTFGDYFGELPSGGVVIGPVVGAVVGGHAGLARTAAWVAADDATFGEVLDVDVEGAAGRDVFEELGAAWGAAKAGGEVDDLGYLTSCDGVVGPEGAIGVALDDALAREAGDEGVEGVIGGYVGEGWASARGIGLVADGANRGRSLALHRACPERAGQEKEQGIDQEKSSQDLSAEVR